VYDRTWRMRVAIVVVVLAVGCGRLRFDPVTDAASFGSTAEVYVKPLNTHPYVQFGYSLALSSDGATLATGGPNEANGAGAAYLFVNAGGTWAQQAYLQGANTGNADQLGISIALSGDGKTLAVGAFDEQSNATGIDGNGANNAADKSGAAYVFVSDGDTWTQQAYVKPSNTTALDEFGVSIALSDDGNTLAVGTTREHSNATGIDGNQNDKSLTDAGAVYVFSRAGATWSQQAYVKASNTDMNDQFGFSLALSADGNVLAVGALGESSKATGVDGDQGDNSLAGAGAVYTFKRSGVTWSQDAYLKASNADMADNFGFAVSLSGDGSRLAVGAVHESSNATGVNGDQADNSAPQSGAAYVFVHGASWIQEAYIKASNTDAADGFGRVALSLDGRQLAVGATQESSAAIGIDGDQADNSVAKSGATYVFASASQWMQVAYLKASNTEPDMLFGQGVGIAANGRVAISAHHEDSDATGIDGDQIDHSDPTAGAAYIIE
jgi:hypothetical protein